MRVRSLYRAEEEVGTYKGLQVKNYMGTLIIHFLIDLNLIKTKQILSRQFFLLHSSF